MYIQLYGGVHSNPSSKASLNFLFRGVKLQQTDVLQQGPKSSRCGWPCLCWSLDRPSLRRDRGWTTVQVQVQMQWPLTFVVFATWSRSRPPPSILAILLRAGLQT